jgi:sigma-B regulation protein RsbQ
LKEASLPTLIFQSNDDALASVAVGEFMKNEMAHCELEIVKAKGHCLHMTHPDSIAPELIRFVNL